MMEENKVADLQLTWDSKEFLKETAKWAYFLSIMGYIGIGLLIIFAIFAGTIFSSLGEAGGMGSFPTALITCLYLLLAVLYFFPVYYLNKFGSNTKTALANNDSDMLGNALEYLKSHYKFIGIMTIVVMSLYVLAIVFAVIAGVAAFAG
jgi:small-conductance mechanosensitive channel